MKSVIKQPSINDSWLSYEVLNNYIFYGVGGKNNVYVLNQLFYVVLK